MDIYDSFIWTHRSQEKYKFVSETHGSKVIGQNVKLVVIVPPSGQIAPYLTFCPFQTLKISYTF